MVSTLNYKVILFLFSIWCPTLLKAQTWSLERCLAYAEENNRELLVNKDKVTVSELERKDASAQLLPNITGRGGIDHYWEIPVQVFPGELLGGEEGSFVPIRLGTPWMGNYGIDADLKLIDPTMWQQAKLAALQKQASLGEQESLRKLLSRNVRMAYHQVQLHRENEKLAEGRYLRYQESHELITHRFNEGLSDQIALNQSKSILYAIKETVESAEAGRQLALIDLKFWMGFPFNDSLSVEERFESASYTTSRPFEPGQLPDYDARQVQVSLAWQQHKLALSALYPSLSLNSGWSRLGFGENVGFLSDPNWFSSGYIGLQLRIPLLRFGAMAYGPKKYKTMAEMAAHEFQHYQQAEEKRFLQEKIALESALQTLAIQEKNLKLADENERLTLRKLEKGLISMIELKQVQQDLDQSRERWHRARLEFLKHALELDYLQNN